MAIDIDQNLCDYYNSIGFKFKCIDATSDFDLGEKFEFIYCGDVIEHVENSTLLLRFVARHLEVGGSCLFTTPNPYCAKYRHIGIANQDFYFTSNLQHVSWIVPSHFLEIIRRSGCQVKFKSIYIPSFALDCKNKIGGNIEEYFEEYIFEIIKT